MLRSPSFTTLFSMPPRSAGQKVINVPMDGKFVAVINEAVERFNYGDRAKLIREAIAEKLERLGVKVPAALTVTPPRVGKGGRRKEEKDRQKISHS